ncbi:hypothetical protein B566_EDAN013717 [Ephemera danica]|nr:hypothetical protein B566_EDAN013717 [Ephemera danica]
MYVLANLNDTIAEEVELRLVRAPFANKGGRGGSGKSRSTSFRRSARTSQRSADSALGLSDSLMTRSSYSDTECRYYDDAGLEVVLTGPPSGSPGVNPATAPGIQRLRASSQHSRYSDSTLQVLPPHGAPSNHQQNQQQQPPPSPTTPGSAESPRAGQGPILFNRYAADDSQVPASNQSSGGSWRRSGQQRTAPGIELDALPAGRGDSVKSTSSLPAPAPSQSGINRYQRQGSARLSRLREDEMQDEYLQPYLQYEPTSDPEWDDVPAKPVPIWLCVFLVLSYIIGGAFLFHHWEEWSILDSAYFCFITLTTIGFGDFVPAQRVTAEANANMSIALCSLYLLFGIALLAMSFNLVQEEVINSVKSVARRLGIIKDVDEEEE